MRKCVLALMISVCLLMACKPLSHPLQHQAYIWQRQWTAEVNQSLALSTDLFSSYRILAAQWQPQGTWMYSQLDLASIAHSGHAVVAVFRLDGQTNSFASVDMIATAQSIISTWRAAGINITGIEIDHDCANARLAAYADFLSSLRRVLPEDINLSITALPTWLDVKNFDQIMAPIDEVVLQVHSVLNPKQGLFDINLAMQWVAHLSKRTSKPFWVALPTYGSRVSFDLADNVVSVESEVPLSAAPISVETKELIASPVAVATLLRQLGDTHLFANLRGVVWFRLPIETDSRTWSLATLRAVIRAQPLLANIEARLLETKKGAYDIVISNLSEIDAFTQTEISIKATDCSSMDATADFSFIQDSGFLRYKARLPFRLRAHQQRTIGWLRCAFIGEIDVVARP